MSYREENGQVVLTMSREDYWRLMIELGASALQLTWQKDHADPLREKLAFVNRLNEGNPNYTPYELKQS